MSDNLSKLAQLLYGREPTAQEYLGGSDAKILADAKDAIEERDAEIARLRKDVENKAAIILDQEEDIARLREDLKDSWRVAGACLEQMTWGDLYEMIGGEMAEHWTDEVNIRDFIEALAREALNHEND